MNAADARLMARALRLAERGLFSTAPNPRVGCVIARDGDIVGEGWHERAGGPHAEVRALQAAGEAACGATAYVSLEPCNHQGRTGPCAQALIAAGIARLVFAAADDGSQSGGGAETLREAGVPVEGGLLAASAEALNPGFHRRLRGGRPWVRVKLAQSLDGRTALVNGQSQWITGEAARADVHRWRARSCAVVTGIGTVLADDPQLTARGVGAVRQPLRVVLDSQRRIAPQARVLDDQAQTLLVHAQGKPGEGVAVLPGADGRVDLGALIDELGRRDLNEIWVEAGATLAGALLRAGLADELVIYTAPSLIGSGRPLLVLDEIQALDERLQLEIVEQRRVGPDWRILARPAP